jgi:hypothetical protein
MASPGNLKLHSFDLADQDRRCLERIKQRLEISSSALAVRIAIRDLARRLSDPSQIAKLEGGANGNE